MDWVNERRLNVVLIGLCQDLHRTPELEQALDQVDEYLLYERFSSEELFSRVATAQRLRRRENKLLHEQALLQSLLDTVPDCIFFKDRESRFTKVNRQMEASYGGQFESLVGKTDSDIFAREHALAAYRDEQAILQSGQAMKPKLEKETFADGRVNWVHTTKVAIKDRRGQIVGTMGIARDVTELKNARDGMESEHSMLRTIIDHALAGIFVKDREGRFQIANKQHVAYLGAGAESDVVGKTLYDFIEHGEAARISEFDRKIMDSGKAIENLVDFRQKKDIGDFWLLTSKVPLRDKTGNVVGLVGISLDITQQKKSEAELKSTIRLLEETRLQLIEAEKFKTVGRLAAGVAHEVKNPLNVISLGAEYLGSQIDDSADLRDVLSDMKEAVGKANNVIFELLDYSCPRTFQMEPGDITELLRRVLRLMRHNFNEAGISVVESLSDDTGPVRLDAQKMEQVFINLFLNAIKAMPEGGVFIVRCEMIRMQKTGATASSDRSALFRVGDPIVKIQCIDSGCGVTPECARRAFEPFYSTKSDGEGSGLGLSVCKNIIEMHRGLIELRNRETETGACLEILLPVSKPN